MNQTKPTVFVPEPIAASGFDLLAQHCRCAAPWRDGDAPAEPALRELLYSADAAIVRLFAIGETDLDRCERLKVIGKHGVGVDNIDCAAASARGVAVVNTPTANANAVAEHTVALMLALARQIGPAWRATVEGRFDQRAQFQGVELTGRTLGVIGLGRIGARVARIAAQGLGMKVLAYDPLITADRYNGPATIADSPEAVFRDADFLTFHVPLTPDTAHMVNDRGLRLMKSGCRIVNTSRGGVIDESALVRGLEEGTIAGAALDVFEHEPLPADHPLCGCPNALLTPHISSTTQESLDRMAYDAARGVLDVLDGRPPEHLVHPGPTASAD